MPIYEYACASCGHTSEALRRMAQADDPIACDKCGSDLTRRTHSVFAAGKSDAGGGDMPLPMGGCGRCGDPNGSCAM